MRRRHWPELEDSPWFPAILRDALTSYLRLVLRVSGLAAAAARHMTELVRETGATRLVDLGSGGGGPIPTILDTLQAAGLELEAVLTDLHPNTAAASVLTADSRIRYEARPIDATAVPDDLKGLRTMFNSFHHLRPELARAVLADAARGGQPIAVYEFVGRSPQQFAGMVTSLLTAFVAVPFLRPFRPAWLIWTWLVPVIPLAVVWDGTASCMRIYEPDDLEALLATVETPPGWRWDYGYFALGPPGAKGTWLHGRIVSEG